MINSINKRKFLFSNLNNFYIQNNQSKFQFNKINHIFSRNFSNSLEEENNEREKTVREKVIENLDYKKIFKKKVFYRNFKVLDTLGQFENYEERDKSEISENMKKKLYASDYLKIHDNWQKNLLKNKIRKGIIKHNFENYKFPETQEEKFIVHNPERVLNLPASDEKLFAVIEFKGLQHKVLKDDRVMLEKINLEVGETFVFDKVLLVASDQYTSLGRPFVSTSKVLAVVEENTRTEKVITFKKKRRKGYQRNMGHRQYVTMVRILKILHNPTEATLDDYHKLEVNV